MVQFIVWKFFQSVIIAITQRVKWIRTSEVQHKKHQMNKASNKNINAKQYLLEKSEFSVLS